MEFLQLKYFQTVARYEHITKAAESLHISQPALSIMISRLEDELGTPLFSRIGRNIKLNEFGKAFLRHVDSIFCELESSKVEINDMLNIKDDHIAMATTHSKFLSGILKDFLIAHGEIKIKQAVKQKDIVERQLKSGEIDLCITFTPIIDKEIECVKIDEDEVVIVVPASHKLAKRKYVNLSELSDELFITLADSSGYDEFLYGLCDKAGFMPNVIFDVDDTLMYEMLQLGRGIALVTESVCRKYEHSNLSIIKIKEPICKMDVSLSWLKGRYLSKTANSFRSL